MGCCGGQTPLHQLMGIEPMQMSIPTVVAITGLTTALLTGTYFHFETVSDLRATIQTLEANSTAAVNPDELAEMQQMISTFTAAPASDPSQGRAAPDNWIYGSTAARFTLVEMTDTECPYCSQHFPILKALIDTSGGHINAALMHVPALSEASRQQALAIECAGEQSGSETAWKFAQLVFDKTGGNGKGVATSLSSLAGELNLDRQRFSTCLDSVEVIDRVVGDMQKALDMDIKQTPSTMVIDNVTGKSIVLQGTNASHEGILDAIAKVGGPGVKQ